ncbi:MAG: carboxymuconolactone decarboxylase family protein [Phycisphaerales bacterium]|nr:carboxymuconolactone decarboxylase family protein [Phycisphaerales bacterium]
MPRLSVVDPAVDSGAGADLLNGPLKNVQINIFKGMATNPAVLKAFVAFSAGVKTGALSDVEHEIIALVCGQKRQCEYCLAAHSHLAMQAGVHDQEVLNIRKGQASDDRHQSLIDFVTAILDTEGFVSDDQLANFRAAGFSDAAVIEVIGGIAVNTMTNLFNHVHETEVDFPVPAAV